ncbi:MAG TPA: adenylate kinase [Thermoleophilia bacterium]|nr:adenylate kinase [Thermoleophilia bacterium]
MSQRNVILLGGPGAGKGTQAERIVVDFKLPHVSTGEMLRAAVARGTEMGREAQKYMESGRLVPDEVVIGVVRDRLAEPDAAEGFLLDGFPRTVPQAEALDAMLAGAGRQITHVVLIDVPAEELVQRIAGRRSCATCGKIYNVTFDPPKVEGVCDLDGGQLTQRADDNEETVRKRIAVYEEQTAPLIGYYTDKGVLESAFGGGKAPDEVYEQVGRILAG